MRNYEICAIFWGRRRIMANLQVRDINEKLYSSLKELAVSNKRSVSQEVAYILKNYVSFQYAFQINPTESFLQLTGSWEDNKTAEEIIFGIRRNL